MSEKLSDLYSWEEESDHWKYLMALATHLTVGSQATMEALEKLSHDWKDAQERLQRLLKKDQQEWALLMIDCLENNYDAYRRCRHLAPWPFSRFIRLVKFDNWSELGKFWRLLFDEEGRATDRGNGNREGYDSYAIIYDGSMSLRQIVKEAIWLGFSTTSCPADDKCDPYPTTPWKKDRLKQYD